MATEIKSSLVSLEGITYDVYLDNGAPDIGGVYLPVRSASLSYKSSSEAVDAPILTSKMSVSFSVRNPTEKAIFTAMVQADEIQYRLRIERGGVLWWVGFVLIDLVSEDFGGYPKDFTVVATDGIARLKTIDYNPNVLAEFATLKDHFFQILSEIPLADYYGVGAEYFRSHMSLFPEGMTPDVTVSQIEQLRISYKALRTVDKRGNIKYKSYYEALEEILQAIGGRLTYSQGRYVLTETTNYAVSGRLVIFHRYEQDGSPLAVETLSSWTPYTVEIGETLATAPAVVLRGGKITYLPPLRSVDLTYKHYSRQNILPEAVVFFGSGFIASLENFGTDEGAGFLSVSGNVTASLTPPVGVVQTNRIYVVLRIRVAIADSETTGQTLQRTATVTSSGISYSTPEWISGITPEYDLVLVFNPAEQLEDGVLPGTQSFSFDTPVVPISGTLNMSVTTGSIIDVTGPVVGYTVAFTVTDFYVESILAGSISEQYDYTDFTQENPLSVDNSLVLEREVLFGDGPGDNTFGRVEYTDDGTTWQRTDGWRRWVASSYISTNVLPLGALVASSTLSLQDSQRERLDVTVIASGYQAEYLFGCDGTLYLMQSGTLELYTDQWRGRWFEIGSNFNYVVNPGTPQVSIPGVDGFEGGTGNEPPTPPIVVGGEIPPGLMAPGLNTVPTVLDQEYDPDPDNPIPGLTVPNLPDVNFFAGDVLTVTDPETGVTTEVVVNYDTGFVPGLQTDPGAVPYYTETGIVWLVPTTDTISIDPQIFADGLSSGSFIQPSAEFTSLLQALLRTDHIEANVAGFDTALTVGFSDWFWRPERRKGWYIRKVHFAFASNPDNATVKANLKYYDATGFRYTVATHDAGGLGSVQDALSDVLAGYYRVEVETITKALPGDADPKGLQVIIEVIKRIVP